LQKRPSQQRIEFGDFQTPEQLAEQVCRLLQRRGIQPRTVIEPTCGTGAFLEAAAGVFPRAETLVGCDVNAAYVRHTRARMRRLAARAKTRIFPGDFFQLDWSALLDPLDEPLLVIGNPPWVCNSAQGTIGGENLPRKKNEEGLPGIAAITGKSNFDVSLWILKTLLDALPGREATLAMLCKTSVARKALQHAWQQGHPVQAAAIYEIDAASLFCVSVSACLLVIQLGEAKTVCQCAVFEKLDRRRASRRIGFRQGKLISHLGHYQGWKHLAGTSSPRWRSGIKHDCAKIMELKRDGAGYRNGLGETVDLEDSCLYPLLKSSNLAKGMTKPDRWMLVPQTAVGEDTAEIQQRAPKTWRYLTAHADRLDRRASSIYRRRPRFSIFGVGEYTFAPWKVAISGFYKQLVFTKLGNFAGKPIVFDDTCYFLPCDSEAEADERVGLLNSLAAREYLSSLIFWDTKRPITAEILQTLDLGRLAQESGARCGVK
jgi:hypothetical protein